MHCPRFQGFAFYRRSRCAYNERNVGTSPITHVMALNPNDRLLQAQNHLQQGNVSAATPVIDTVLRQTPSHPHANYLLGLIRLMAGDAQSAIAPLEITLKADPHNGAALDSLGLCYLMQQRFGDAESVLRRAAGIPGAPAIVSMRLGMALLHQHKTKDAIQLLQRAVELGPQDVDCHVNLAQALHRDGQTIPAQHQLETALALAPGNADILFNLGVICLEQNALDTAASWFEKAITRAPRHAEAWTNLGIVQERQRALDAALTCYRKALEIDPRLVAAGNNLAHGLTLQHRYHEARIQYLATLHIEPGYIAAHEGLASACLALGRIHEAIEHLRITVQAEPHNHGALSALAKALFETGQLAEAEPLARRACELNPDSADSYSTLANLFAVQGATEQTIATLESGYQRTRSGGLLGMLAFQYRQICDWPKWEASWQALVPQIDISAGLGSPFWLLCEPISARQQLTYTRAWAEARFKAMHTPAPPPAAAPHHHSRLRIGYLSSDFQEHPAAYLIADVLERHDRSRFEIFAYSYGPEDDSAMRRRLRTACEHFVDIAWDTDDAAAARIRNDEIDILIDLKGYTVGDRLTIMARRPCPIQVTWLGYPGTTGVPFIDYLIADPTIVRAGEESTCVERVLRMPHCYQPNDRKRAVAEPLSRAAYGLPDDGFVFCCFNQPYKITPDVFAVWMRLLKHLPHSVLWLVDGGALAKRNLISAANATGVAAEQLVFAPRRPYGEHLARYRAADLALDTFPYTSHTTLSDALWCGCPTAGLTGEPFASRVSGSILSAAGLGDLVTDSLIDYEQLALRIATNGALLERIRERVARARDQSPLFDSETFTRDLERLLEGLIAQPPNV